MSERSKATYSSGTLYRFRLESDLVLHFPGLEFGRHSFRDSFDREWLVLRGHTLIIRKGYAWDGNSPKLKIGTWVGTPDFKGTRMASCVHDALYQFLHLPCFPLTRKQCDDIFVHLMEAHGFRLAGLYYGAVRLFGGLFHGVRKDTSLVCYGSH